MNKGITVKVADTVNRTSGYVLIIDLFNGYGWRHFSFGSWEVFMKWVRDNDIQDYRVFVSGR